MNRRLTRMPAILAALALLGAACTGPGTSPSTAVSAAASVQASEAAPSEAPSATPEASEEGTATERVRLTTSQFDPTELTIAAGTEVTFVNAATFDHTVTEGTDGQAVEDPIVDEEIAPNGAVRVTFDEPGIYEITCRIHPSMQLTITVTE
jgi:plastocyanin